MTDNWIYKAKSIDTIILLVSEMMESQHKLSNTAAIYTQHK